MSSIIRLFVYTDVLIFLHKVWGIHSFTWNWEKRDTTSQKCLYIYRIVCILFFSNTFIKEAFLVHLSRRLKCTIVITRCPSSVVRPSVVVNFSHFRLLLWICWTEFNETWQEARSQRPLPSLCFSGRSEKQDGRPGLWLAETFSTSPLNLLNGIQRNLTGSKISTSSTKFVFFGPIRKTRWPPWSLIGWDIFDFSSETAERNSTTLDRKQDPNVLYQVCVFRADRKNKMAALASDWLRHFRLLLWNLLNGIKRNLTGSKISTSSTKFVFFGPIGKTRWPRWPLIGWDIFDSSSETAEQNSTKLDRKQELNVLYQVCVFRADWKNKMAALASDWLRHFRLLLWNRWTEFNETWQEARSKRPLPSLCFSGRSEKQDGRPGLWLAETFSTSPLKPFERNSTKLDWKQDLNILYQVCVFRANRKNKMAALASDWLRHFRLLLWHCWTEFNETWQEARTQRPLPSLCFSGRLEKQDGRPGLWLAETFSTSPLKPLDAIQWNLIESKISTSSTKSVFSGPIGKTRWPPWLIRQKGGTLYSGERYVALLASC